MLEVRSQEEVNIAPPEIEMVGVDEISLPAKSGMAKEEMQAGVHWSRHITIYSWTMEMQAGAGEVTLGPALIRVDGEELEVGFQDLSTGSEINKRSIVLGSGSLLQPPPPRPPHRAGLVMHEVLLLEPGDTSGIGELKAVIEPEEIGLGEAATYSLYLRTNVIWTALSAARIPRFPDLDVERVAATDQDLNPQIVRGKEDKGRVVQHLLLRVRLSPSTSGVHTIGTAGVIVRSYRKLGAQQALRQRLIGSGWVNEHRASICPNQLTSLTSNSVTLVVRP